MYLKLLSNPNLEASEEHKTVEKGEKVGGEMEYFVTMLDRTKNENQVESFLQETLCKLSESLSDLYQPHCSLPYPTFTMWLAPNHRLLDLTAVEADDLLVIGTHE